MTVIMFVIITLLAFQQYQWLGQIGEQELERMRRNVQTAAMQLSQDLSRDIARLFSTVLDHSKSEPFSQKLAQNAIARWRLSASFPGIVMDSITAGRYIEQEHDLRFRAEQHEVILRRDLSELIVVNNDNDTSQSIIIPINRNVLSRTVLPQLVRSHLYATIGEDFDVVIGDRKGMILFSNTKNTDSLFRGFDAMIPLLVIPPSFHFGGPSGVSLRDEEQSGRGRRPLPFGRFDDPPVPEEVQREERFRPSDEWWRDQVDAFIEIRIKHRNGSLEEVVQASKLRNVAISFTILLILGASVVVLLISAHRSRQLAQQQLEFVASISHELRTPLAALKSAGENLADGVIRERGKVRSYGELIKKEVMRLISMVDRSISYAAIQSGRMSMEHQTINLASLLVHTVEEIQRSITGTPVVIKTDIAENIMAIKGDVDALHSALSNLLHNAVKYGGTKISVILRPILNGTFLELVITDNGIGIPPKELKHIFTPFFRASNAVERQVEGNGLGLSITSHIVHRHNGSIHVESASDGCTQFIIQLPTVKNGKTS